MGHQVPQRATARQQPNLRPKRRTTPTKGEPPEHEPPTGLHGKAAMRAHPKCAPGHP